MVASRYMSGISSYKKDHHPHNNASIRSTATSSTSNNKVNE